jgi:sulfite reductase alpha subunit-like flavoprotein
VQDLVLLHGAEVVNQMRAQAGHVYLCGAVSMAQSVRSTLQAILCQHANLSEQEAEKYIVQMKVRLIFLSFQYT